MDLKTRAELVREHRFEIKLARARSRANRPLSGDGRKLPRGSGQPNARNYADTPNPTPRDNVRRYVNDGMTDGGIYDRAARWDRMRATQVPKRQRRNFPRAARDGADGYVGYDGNWQGHFGGTAPARNPRIRVNKRRPR